MRSRALDGPKLGTGALNHVGWLRRKFRRNALRGGQSAQSRPGFAPVAVAEREVSVVALLRVSLMPTTSKASWPDLSGLGPAIHVFARGTKDVDARDKSGQARA